MLFFGSHRHTLDEKGRVFIPKKYLGAFSDGDQRLFMATAGMDRCVVLYTLPKFQEMATKLQGASVGVDENRKFLRVFFNLADSLDIDKNGRILLPEPLRAKAGLVKDVVFSGMGDWIEIWDARTYDAQMAPALEEFHSHAKSVGL